MRSKANFKTHPIHPMVVAFPITFITVAPFADLVGSMAGWPSMWTIGAYSTIAAVVTGVVAGIPGFIDYLYVVPPKSSASQRALYHMIVNLVGLAIMAASWAFRNWQTHEPMPIAILLETASLVFIAVGGWMGGTLVYRNQIGVDHRYAEAGKWQEQTSDAKPGEPIVVEKAGELEVDQMILVKTPDRRIVLARTEKGFVAFDDACTHKGGSLAGGMMACGTVMCPWHGSQFDVRDGSVQAGPAEKPISTYEVKSTEGKVRITL